MWSCTWSNKRVKSCYCARARLSTDQGNLWRGCTSSFAPDDKCAPRSTRSLLSTASGSGRPARCETRWPVDVARLASRRRAQALIRARQHAQQHAFIFVHADSQPTCIMIRFIAEQRPLAGSKRNRRANTTRAVPPFSRLQNACRCPTCSTPCSCDCSPASSAICTGDWSRTT
jgi:hypothetical protein